MPIPVVPIASAVLKYGPLAAAALATVAYARARPAPVNQAAEDLMEDVDEGVAFSRAPEGQQVNGQGRYRRTVRMPNGIGFEVDASVLGRVRLRRV
ncbi:hypothetical protein Dshi_3280 [Dinoroseobacter shibae DFL 12 = DSM 16493]|jgi:hypothetical protein|uniref:Uncharacterized protein n=1 Tax=Dinoroseobacter shibae (strain DSM 16493 / NCIMB 14021 / DFL 12) TaxID=398580 RepID=A8LMT8_DINSH|nr:MULTISPECIES: hypothetical protein [Dinoroseobacter]ABV95013.1 hypothetical protein Dshi_3280 [Dinoroseobacter shibae DFL 12 = DSM 16493]MDD9717866.1 hypothetical protein [Dinoroseobacter sp. PD6]URF46431.1 hypothetical protein M8008_16865 [Dinoroseobacter shibae]URF50737.1 hypothetical protein M8007_16865 [Dinoroseobacter shibae]